MRDTFRQVPSRDSGPRTRIVGSIGPDPLQPLGDGPAKVEQAAEPARLAMTATTLAEAAVFPSAPPESRSRSSEIGNASADGPDDTDSLLKT